MLLTTATASAELISEIIPGVQEAGNPYFDFMFGGDEIGRSALTRWMKRATSEVFVERAVILRVNKGIAGGFIALGGEELTPCRRMDMTSLIMTGTREHRDKISERLSLVADLFSPVRADEFYLSKLWVNSEYRGAGHSRSLMKNYIELGQKRGYRRFRLDVAHGNQTAIHLYRSLGFEVIHESAIPETELHYLGMAREFPS